MKLPTVWPDEYAYLAYAKFFAGLGISEVFNGELLGSFGYSLLIAPAFILFKNPISSFQTVIFINSLLAPTLYIVGYMFLNQVVKIEKKYAIIVSILICLYPAYLLQSNSAYTECLTPTLFLLSVLSFWHFIQKQNYLWAIIYSLVLGFFFSVHIRIVPTIVLSIFFIVFLTTKQVISKKIGIFTIILQIFIFTIIYYIGTSLTTLFSPDFNATYKVATRLLSQVDMVFLLFLLFFNWFFIARKKYFQLVILYISILAGFLFEIKLISFFLIALALISIIILLIRKKIELKESLYLIIAISILYVLSFIVVPEIKYITVSFQLLYLWLVSTVGTLYYLTVASYGLFLLGILYLVYLVLVSKQEVGNYLESYQVITFLFIALLSFSLLFITITPRQMLASEGRADHLFYGRYSEVFLAIYLLLGLIALIKRKSYNIKSMYILAGSILFLFFIILLLNYGNIIPTELSFLSVLSFFPYRAVLGNINLILFSGATIVLFIILTFLFHKKQVLGYIFIGLLFLSFSIFTYYFTFYYYQQDAQQRTQLISNLRLLKPYYSSLGVDKTYAMNSNAYNYSFLLPGIVFNFQHPNKFNDSCSIVLSGPFLNEKHMKDAVPIGTEIDGNDLLWALPGAYYESLINRFSPSFLNMDLIDSNIIGFKKTGFYNGNWVNGRAAIRFSVKNTDTIRAIVFRIKSNNSVPHNLIVWLDNKEIFNQNIDKGAWEYDLKVKMDAGSNFHEIKFFSDLIQKTRESVVGIGLLSLKFIADENNFMENYISRNEADYFNYLHPTPYLIQLRSNYRIYNMTVQRNEIITVPIDLVNLDFEQKIINQQDSIFLSYRWRDFIFQNIKSEGQPLSLTKAIQPGEKQAYFLEIDVPEKPGKYFLEFDLKSNKFGWLDLNSNFIPRYIIIVK